MKTIWGFINSIIFRGLQDSQHGSHLQDRQEVTTLHYPSHDCVACIIMERIDSSNVMRHSNIYDSLYNNIALMSEETQEDLCRLREW